MSRGGVILGLLAVVNLILLVARLPVLDLLDRLHVSDLLTPPPVRASAEEALPRARISLNGAWSLRERDDAPLETVRVPEDVGGQRNTAIVWRSLEVPAAWKGRGRVILEVEKACHWARFWWNDKPAGEHYGTRTSFALDVTDHVRYGRVNRILVRLENAWMGHPGPGVESTDYNVVKFYITSRTRSRFAGITGNISLVLVPTVRLVTPRIVTSVRQHTLAVSAAVRNDSDRVQRVQVQGRVRSGVETVKKLDLGTVEVPPGAQRDVQASVGWVGARLWGPPGYGEPHLYDLDLEVIDAGREVDRLVTRFGFRELWFDGYRLMLNGQPIFLLARRLFNAGFPVAERHTVRWAFHELMASGVNATESHEESHPEWFYDTADETGMLTISGLLCYGAIGADGDGISPQAAQMLADTSAHWYQQERNHPSIIMWNPCIATPNLRRPIFTGLLQADNTRLVPFENFVPMTTNLLSSNGWQTVTDLAPGSNMPVWLGEITSQASGFRAQDVHFFLQRMRQSQAVFGGVLPDYTGREGIWQLADGAPWPSLARPDPLSGTGRVDRPVLPEAMTSINLLSVLEPAEASALAAQKGRARPFPSDVLVRASRQGQPIEGRLVMLVPRGDQPAAPQGALTDPAGTAFFSLRHAGRYAVLWSENGTPHEKVFMVKPRVVRSPQEFGLAPEVVEVGEGQ